MLTNYFSSSKHCQQDGGRRPQDEGHRPHDEGHRPQQIGQHNDRKCSVGRNVSEKSVGHED